MAEQLRRAMATAEQRLDAAEGDRSLLVGKVTIYIAKLDMDRAECMAAFETVNTVFGEFYTDIARTTVFVAALPEREEFGDERTRVEVEFEAVVVS